MSEIADAIKMCPYYETCKFPSDNCTKENAEQDCELFEDFEKSKINGKEK
jgi:hypothetical protein